MEVIFCELPKLSSLDNHLLQLSRIFSGTAKAKTSQAR